MPSFLFKTGAGLSCTFIERLGAGSKVAQDFFQLYHQLTKSRFSAVSKCCPISGPFGRGKFLRVSSIILTNHHIPQILINHQTLGHVGRDST